MDRKEINQRLESASDQILIVEIKAREKGDATLAGETSRIRGFIEENII